MSLKKMDKDHLINDLTEYLSNQYMKIVESKENLLQKKYQLEEEKLRVMHTSTSSDVARMKQMFSPLSFDVSDTVKESGESKKISKEMRQIELEMKEAEKTANQIKDYIQGLKESYFLVDDVKEDKNQERFLPAFYELLDYIKKTNEELDIAYTPVGSDTEVLLTFSFLRGFQQMLHFLENELLVSQLKIDFFVERQKVMVQFITQLEVMDSLDEFKRQRMKLEQVLSQEFSITRWQESSIILQALIE